MVDKAAKAYKLGARLARMLPTEAVDPVNKALGAIAARFAGDRRLIVERNLERVYGPMPKELMAERVNASFANYAAYWVQSFRLPDMGAARVSAGFRYVGFEHIVGAVEDPDSPGPILALPHLGGWEWAAFWLALVPHYKVTGVVEQIDSEELFEWFLEFRESLGMNMIPLGPEAGAGVMNALKANHVICLLADRDIENNGVEVEFFGERTTLPAGPATLALRTGAALIPTVCYFEGEGVYAIAGPPIDTTRQGKFREDVVRLTQELAYVFEEQIRRAPEQWHLLQPNWPSDFEALGLPMPQ